MAKKLLGKTALITGAGRGVGRATAQLFARHGAALILVARTRDELDDTAAICRRENARVAQESVDLAQKDQIDLLFEKLWPQFPRIDILINNAAMFDRGLMRQYPMDRFELMFRTNVLALENKDRGIRANQISLSGVDTRMFREASPPGVKADLTLEEVAEKILFLASDDSAPMTGQSILMPELP